MTLIPGRPHSLVVALRANLWRYASFWMLIAVLTAASSVAWALRLVLRS